MKNTLQEIKDKLSGDSLISEDKKNELLSLLDELEGEMGNAGSGDQMRNISSHVKRTAEEVIKEEKNPDLIEKALNDLRDSVTEFEVSHPKLFEKVNNISAMLASMGI
jgi:hypothetical protein